MKKCILIIGILFSIVSVQAQEQEMEQLILDIEKLTQFKQILTDMKEGYDILTKGYEAVKDISQGNFNLHKVFLDGLLAVSPAVQNYEKVARIIANQVTIVGEYKTAFTRAQSSGQFNPDEIVYISTVYGNLFDASLKNIDDLTIILTAGSLRMSDAERLKAIDQLDRDMTDKLSFLRYFNNNTALLSLQRAREHNSVQAVQNMHGLTP